MIRLSIAAAALALLAATNPGAAQDYGYGYNSYKPSYGYSRYGYKGYDSYSKPSYGYSRYGYKGYGYEKPSYGYGYSRYGYQGYSTYEHPSDFGFNSPYYGRRY
jgi:hypothetical protein